MQSGESGGKDLIKNISLKDQSKKEFSIMGTSASHEEIRTGCLQRIADAQELMAKNYKLLIDERNFFRRRMEEEIACCKRLVRRNNSLRGHITRLKKQSK